MYLTYKLSLTLLPADPPVGDGWAALESKTHGRLELRLALPERAGTGWSVRIRKLSSMTQRPYGVPQFSEVLPVPGNDCENWCCDFTLGAGSKLERVLEYESNRTGHEWLTAHLEKLSRRIEEAVNAALEYVSSGELQVRTNAPENLQTNQSGGSRAARVIRLKKGDTV